jgi:hypothetical protein
MARQLYVDINSGRLVGGVNSSALANLNLFSGDVADYELYFLTESSTGKTIYEPLNYSANSVKLYIGEAPPSTATAYVAVTAWTNTTMTVSSTITRSTTGTSAVNEVQTLTHSPDALDGTFSITIPSRTVAVSSITAGIFTTSGNHGLAVYEPFIITGTTTPSNFSNGQTLYAVSLIGPTQFYANSVVTETTILTYGASGGGTIYTVTASSQAISARASIGDMTTALENMACVGTGNVSVSGVLGRQYRLTFQSAKSQTPLSLATVTGALTPLYGKAATISFTSTALTNAISASASIDAVLEIEVTNGSLVDTQLQQSVTITNDLIP